MDGTSGSGKMPPKTEASLPSGSIPEAGGACKKKPQKTSTDFIETPITHRKPSSSEVAKGPLTFSDPDMDQWASEKSREQLIDDTLAKYLAPELEKSDLPEHIKAFGKAMGIPDEHLRDLAKEHFHLDKAGVLASKEYKIIDDQLKAYYTDRKLWGELSAEDKANLYLALLVVRERIGDAGRQTVTKQLLRAKPETLVRRMMILGRQKACHIQRPTIQDHFEVSLFHHLARETKFSPAIWELVKLSLLPGSSMAFSPGWIVELMSECPDPNLTRLLISATSLDARDVDYIHGTLSPGIKFDQYQQAVWMFAEIIAPLNRPPAPGDNSGFPPEVQYSIMYLLQAAMLSKSMEGDKEALKKAVSGSGDAQHIPETVLAHLANLKKWKDKLTPYQLDIANLTLGLLAMQGFLGGKNMLMAADYLAQAASHGNFPLLYRDAALIFIAFGRYREAAECLSALLQCDLPDTLRSVVLNHLELCDSHLQPELASPVPDTTTDDAGEITRPSGSKTRTRRRKRKKKRSGPAEAFTPDYSQELKEKDKDLPYGAEDESTLEPILSNPVSDPVATTTSGFPEPESLDDRIRTPTPEEVMTPTVAVEAEVSQASPNKKPEAKPAVDKTPEITPVKIKEPEPDIVYPDGRGWASDYNPAILNFNQTIENFRETEDWVGEESFIVTSMEQNRGKPCYGRMCEEYAWFHIKQLGKPGQEISPKESRVHNKTLLNNARDWLTQALACYLQHPVPTRISAADLKRMIQQCYGRKPEMAENPEFRKRLRCICSSLGHVREKLAGATFGKDSGEHAAESHQLYQLKQLADPHFQMQTYQPFQPKVALVSREEFERRR